MQLGFWVIDLMASFLIIETVEQVGLHVAWARYNDHGELGRLS